MFGLPVSWPQIDRRVCSWPRVRNLPATGRRTTTGADVRRGSQTLPQFKTEIDGVDIHFIHVKSPHANALPLIITHGWPGSLSSCSKSSGRLPTPLYGGSPEAASSISPAVHARIRLLLQPT